MKIILAEYRGFCYGVKRAIETAYACIGQGPVYTLGPIIHNPQLVQRLSEQGVVMANTLEQIPAGRVIIRSHGVGPEVYDQARARSLEVVDATCPHVRKAQQAARQLAEKGYYVAVVGEPNHPEVKSIVAWAGERVTVVETPADAQNLPYHEQLGVVAQTTFASDQFNTIVDILKTKCREIEVSRTICTATDQRQQAAIKLARKVDVMVVVGGKNSANTSRLAELCRLQGCPTYHVETAQELKIDWFTGVQTVGITAGASTPDWIIEEVYSKMQEFDQLLDQDMKPLEPGVILKGRVVGVRKDEVFVDIGHKGEGVIPLTELAYPVPENASDVVSEGDEIDVYVLAPEGDDGPVKLSKVKADNIVAWEKLQAAAQANETVTGKVTAVVKGGLAVSLYGVRGFVPASQVAVQHVADLTPYVGQTLELLPIEIDQAKQKIVLSRRKVLEQEQQRRAEELFSRLAEGQIVTGTVSRIADFGVFVDLGGVDGLIHISDLSWHRVKNPTEVVNIGDEVQVFVQKVDPKAKRISLSLKRVQRDPWYDVVEGLREGMTVAGKVTKLAKFGAFVEVKPGVEGLVHLSELADRRVASAQEVVEVGQTVTVKILGIDKENKRISLSIAQAQQDAERADYQRFLSQESNTLGVTIGEKFGHLFGRKG
ncbi:hydroxymethylbutenyl pyrophosphate reductase [Thermosinus carboxydivorans Nor1]|uniref:4-hydroxy-3-methylbut-2-enyl diphosphate reductase n=1 Tax=Thermosinus carboxydivorans Nor1 TaxID=401526 RepID=A1HTW2_9FIRM|nr:bifunctional 4-hydroxy-3-methylbut-2-enyl diphosphate reductase/30S ribosomal protein S1 [Thermosinus carboxydivorans]EAX46538.1 hydroxymethylbutenyl pyrophosphate reductase [Thermosinus carboxydivorans Nor1]